MLYSSDSIVILRGSEGLHHQRRSCCVVWECHREKRQSPALEKDKNNSGDGLKESKQDEVVATTSQLVEKQAGSMLGSIGEETRASSEELTIDEIEKCK